MSGALMARVLDVSLLVLAGLTVALTLWKALALYLPRLLGRESFTAGAHSALELDVALERAESGVPILATVAATAPFLGLAATVLHIMDALSTLATNGTEIALIARPVATALHSTLLGLASAVPAACAYNLFARRLQLLENRTRRRLTLSPKEC